MRTMSSGGLQKYTSVNSLTTEAEGVVNRSYQSRVLSEPQTVTCVYARPKCQDGFSYTRVENLKYLHLSKAFLDVL